MTKFDTQISKLLVENSKEQPVMTVVETGFRKGYKEWRLKNGKLHREDGPAIISPNGDKWWYINNNLHRIGGPAYEGASGYKVWFINGNEHREDGPAVERQDGHKEWWLNGKRLSEDEWRVRVNIKNNVSPEYQQSVIDILDL